MLKDASDVYELTVAVVLIIAGSMTLWKWLKKNVADRKFKPVATDWTELFISLGIFCTAIAYVSLVFNWDVLTSNSHTLNDTGKYFTRTGIIVWALMTILHAINGNLNLFIDNAVAKVSKWIGKN
jgi:hypothetical protein